MDDILSLLTSIIKTFKFSSTTKSTRIISKKLRDEANWEVADTNDLI